MEPTDYNKFNRYVKNDFSIRSLKILIRAKMGEYFFVINKNRKVIVKPKVANWKYCEFEFADVIKIMGWNLKEVIYAIGDNGSIIWCRGCCDCIDDSDHLYSQCSFKNVDFSDFQRKLLCEKTGTVEDSTDDFFDSVTEWLKYERDEL